MRILYFDCFAGISGDMTVGALLSAGMPIEHLRSELSKLSISGYSIASRTFERSMISSVKFEVILQPDHSHSHEEHDHHGDSHTHTHEHHTHNHEHHSHNHEHHSHNHEHEGHSHEMTSEIHVHTHGLSYKAILELIWTSGLTERVKERASKIFGEIARGESKIHNVSLEDVHFHEVGAIDSIVDIVSVAIGLEFFGIDECRSRPVPLGSGGFIRTAHGVMPIPTPATLEIMTGYPTEAGAVASEMTTPTGAGIIKALSSGMMKASAELTTLAVGYGAGTKEFREVPNLLRIVIGDVAGNSQTSSFGLTETILEMTATIDDMPAHLIAYACEGLIELGALDAYQRPIIMKKGRAAVELVILVRSGSVERTLSWIERETTTIGIRILPVERRYLPRVIHWMEHPDFGPFRVKRIGSGETLRDTIEYEDVKRIAKEKGLPIRDVYTRLRQAV